MKKLIIIIFFFCTLHSRSQTSVYHPFPDSNAYWNFFIEYFCFPMQNNITDHYSIEYAGDTLIGGTSYHILRAPFLQSGSNGLCPFYPVGYKGAVRQDTSLKKVYIVPPGDSLEQVLYDFSLQVGDTVEGYLERYNSTIETVISMDSVIVGGDYRKRWLINPMYQLYLIEGVGWMDGLIEASPGEILDAPYHGMMCFSQNGVMLFSVGISDCNLIDNVSIKEEEYQISFFPNPATTVSLIRLPEIFFSGSYRVYDSFGKMIDKGTTGRNAYLEYDLSALCSGIYIMEFISTDGEVAMSKLIKE